MSGAWWSLGLVLRLLASDQKGPASSPDHFENLLIWVDLSRWSPLAFCNMSLERQVGSLVSRVLSATFPPIIVKDSSILYMYKALSSTVYYITIICVCIAFCSINSLPIIVHYSDPGHVFQVFRSCEQHQHGESINIIHHKIGAGFRLNIGFSKT
jgi:hypothetical protein